ncbi:MAG: alpha/beta fold hydrolase [Desulfosudaceae bacterium]
MKKISQLLALLLAGLLLAGCAGFQNKLFDWGLSLERGRSDLEAGTIQVDGRTTAYVERAGQPGGGTIVLLHGFTADKDNWIRFVRHLPERYRVLAVDLPGHGGSTQDMSQRYAVSDITGRLAASLERLVPEPFHLAGNSLGGLVSIYYTLAHPDQVRSLGLFNAAGVISPQPSRHQQLADQGRNMLLPATRAEFLEMLDFVFCEQPFIPWPGRNVLARNYLDNYAFNKKMWQDLHARDAEMDVSPRLSELDLPVLVLWGDQDKVLDVSAVEVFARHLPRSATVIMEDCGHLPMMERPQESAAHYRRFLETAAAAGTDVSE